MNDHALSPAGMIFSIFCLFVVVAGLVFIVAEASNTPPPVDSYGQNASTIDPAYNATYNLTMQMENTGTSSSIPLVLIAGAVFACFGAFIVYAAIKNR